MDLLKNLGSTARNLAIGAALALSVSYTQPGCVSVNAPHHARDRGTSVKVDSSRVDVGAKRNSKNVGVRVDTRYNSQGEVVWEKRTYGSGWIMKYSGLNGAQRRIEVYGPSGNLVDVIVGE